MKRDVTPSLIRIVGDDLSNEIQGTGNSERISARGGSDAVTGSAGDDTVLGGDGNDKIIGDGFYSFPPGGGVYEYKGHDQLFGGSRRTIGLTAVGDTICWMAAPAAITWMETTSGMILTSSPMATTHARRRRQRLDQNH